MPLLDIANILNLRFFGKLRSGVRLCHSIAVANYAWGNWSVRGVPLQPD